MFFKSNKKLDLSIEIDSKEKTPDGLPLLFGTPESPARIEGKIVFEADQDCCKGCPDIEILYKCSAQVEWTTWAGRYTQMGSGYKRYDGRRSFMPLDRTDKGHIKASRHVMEISIPVDPTFPSSMILAHGRVSYLLKVKLARKFPKKDMLAEQLIWVMNSPMPPPSPITVSEPDPTEQRPATSPFTFELPASVFYAGETFPMVIQTQYLFAEDVDNKKKVDEEGVYGADKMDEKKLLALDEKAVLVSASHHDDQSSNIGGDQSREKKDQEDQLKDSVQILAVTTSLKQTDIFTDKNESDRFIVFPHRFECEHPVDGTDDARWETLMSARGGRVVVWVTMPNMWDLNSTVDSPCLSVQHRIRINIKLKAKGDIMSKTLSLRLPISILPPPRTTELTWRFKPNDWMADSVEGTPSRTPVPRSLVPQAEHQSKVAQVVEAVTTVAAV